MSYIQINIGPNNIPLQGSNELSNLRGLKFNQLAMETIVGLSSIDSPTKNVYAMVYGGLVGNAFVKREEFLYGFEDVCDWVDEIYSTDPSCLAEVEKVMSSTQLFKSLLEKAQVVLNSQQPAKKKKPKKSPLQ